MKASEVITVSSTAFKDGETIPAQFTCDGADEPPPLAWSGVPSGIATLALVVDDPDARGFIHWLAADIPAGTTSLEEGSTVGLQGRNDFGRTGYGGPCPPIGRHRYFHKLYAVDIVLPSVDRPRKGALEKAMQGHILAQASLVGTYEKQP